MNPFDDNASPSGPARLSASDDEYDLNAHTVSDGFRPAAAADPTYSSHAAAILQPPPPVATQLPNDRPSSTSKPSRLHDSLTLRHDGSSSPRRRPSDAPVVPDAESASPHVPVETPYWGPTGPSHPYQMYPQRTFSDSSSSTMAPHTDQQSYRGPRGPTHPYALYTQNTATSEDANEHHILAGFADMGASYRRQLGPDGEEAGDLIGPLGHLEELPPYSRYPDEAYARKSPEPAQVRSIPGAGGIGIATRDPEFSSAEDDLAVPISRPPSRSDESHHEINAAAKELSEKPQLTKWQRRARKKLWGVVPYWAICLLLSGIIIMGIVMGAVIGTLLTNHDDPEPPPDGQFDHMPTEPPSDALPMQTLPADLPTLATGFSALPPLDTSQAPKSCFSDPKQAQAWSCDMPFRFYSMNVSFIPTAPVTGNYELSLTPFNASWAKFIWGTQPPNIPDPKPLLLVTDTFEEGRGPAWWVKVKYNKTVIVSEDNFPVRNSKRGRPFFGTAMSAVDGPFRRSFGAIEGDRPWICTWPDATLEIFIYANQTASVLNGPPPPPPPPPPGTPPMTADYASPTGDFPLHQMPPYPKVVKFLERRYDYPNTTPVCRQVEIIDNGYAAKDLYDSTGNPIEVIIVENNSMPGTPLAQHGRAKRHYPGPIAAMEVQELTSCGCLWWST